MHRSLDLLALLLDLICAKLHLLLQTLHLFATTSHGVGLLVSRCVFDSLDDLLDFLVLIL